MASLTIRDIRILLDLVPSAIQSDMFPYNFGFLFVRQNVAGETPCASRPALQNLWLFKT